MDASMNPEKSRCHWCEGDAMYEKYHDEEWGVPVWDDQKLFEYITLEGAQAGLSWITILRKRQAYREAFAQFDPVKVASFTRADIEKQMENTGIVRYLKKIESAVKNAQAFLKIQEEFDSFAAYQWRFVDGKTLQTGLKSREQAVAKTAISESFSKDLKARGFSFLGPVVVYAHMQACGMVNDHFEHCFRYAELGGQSQS
jgi:DNA-3-methyladenine glycosylase I